MAYLVLAALVFGVCFLVDKGFTKLFRNRQQHKSGMAVKHNKRAALFGLVLGVLGIAGILAGIGGGVGLLMLSAIVLLMAVGLIVYYLSFGIYYDEKSFLVSSLGKQSKAHSYGDIREQKLYVVQGGSVIVELHMADGSAVSVQNTMDGAYPFLDYAFARWCEQKNLDPEGCDFHDPGKFHWFPEEEAQ
jgi:hypothetical protein